MLVGISAGCSTQLVGNAWNTYGGFNVCGANEDQDLQKSDVSVLVFTFQSFGICVLNA